MGRDGVKGALGRPKTLSDNEVKLIQKLHIEGWSLMQLARRFAVCKTTICKVIRGDY